MGVAEMARVVAPGGLVTAYAWDMDGGGFPYAVLQTEIAAMGIVMPTAPSVEASRLEVMRALWQDAGLMEVETTVITVQREFASFDEYWAIVQKGPSVKAGRAGITPEASEKLKTRMREILVPDSTGKITIRARANAVQGRVAL